MATPVVRNMDRTLRLLSLCSLLCHDCEQPATIRQERIFGRVRQTLRASAFRNLLMARAGASRQHEPNHRQIVPSRICRNTSMTGNCELADNAEKIDSRLFRYITSMQNRLLRAPENNSSPTPFQDGSLIVIRRTFRFRTVPVLTRALIPHRVGWTLASDSGTNLSS